MPCRPASSQIWPYLLKVIGTAEIHQNGSQTETPRAEAAQEGRLHQLGGRQQPSRSQSYEKVGKNVNSLLWRFDSIQYIMSAEIFCWGWFQTTLICFGPKEKYIMPNFKSFGIHLSVPLRRPENGPLKSPYQQEGVLMVYGLKNVFETR